LERKNACNQVLGWDFALGPQMLFSRAVLCRQAYVGLPIGHRLRLNEYILYVFGQTRRPLAVSRAKICPGSRPEVPSTPKPQERRYEVSRPTRADSSRLIGSDYL